MIQDVPAGHIAAIVTDLEMTAPPADPGPAAPLVRWRSPDLDAYRALFREIGEEWLWFSRLSLPDEALAAILHDPQVEMYAGPNRESIVELDFRDARRVRNRVFRARGAHDRARGGTQADGSGAGPCLARGRGQGLAAHLHDGPPGRASLLSVMRLSRGAPAGRDRTRPEAGRADRAGSGGASSRHPLRAASKSRIAPGRRNPIDRFRRTFPNGERGTCKYR